MFNIYSALTGLGIEVFERMSKEGLRTVVGIDVAGSPPEADRESRLPLKEQTSEFDVPCWIFNIHPAR